MHDLIIAQAPYSAVVHTLEASNTGRAAEPSTGTSWVNQHGVTGLVVPPEDAVSLAGAIKRLAGNEDERRAFGQAGLRRAREEFSIEQMLARTETVYREVLGE